MARRRELSWGGLISFEAGRSYYYDSQPFFFAGLMMLDEFTSRLAHTLLWQLTSYYLCLFFSFYFPSILPSLLSCALKYFVKMWRTLVHLCWWWNYIHIALIVRFVCTWSNVWNVIYDSSDLCWHSFSHSLSECHAEKKYSWNRQSNCRWLNAQHAKAISSSSHHIHERNVCVYEISAREWA